jgi:hypothetical protein
MVQEEMGEIKEDQRNGDTFRSVGAVKWLVYRISYSMWLQSILSVLIKVIFKTNIFI